MKAWISEYKDISILHLAVQPGAKFSEIVGEVGEPVRLKVRIKAPPVEGKANKEVIKFIASLLKIRKNQVEIYRGELSRHKDVLVEMPVQTLAEMIDKMLDKKA